jgi:hypothetical protein
VPRQLEFRQNANTISRLQKSGVQVGLKPPLLLYETHDLHQVDTFKDFLAEYGPIYINMFLKYLDYHDEKSETSVSSSG